MKSRNILLTSLLLLSTTIAAQKPKWIGNTPKELNNTYKFVEIVSYGSNETAARIESTKKLAQDEQLVRTVNVNVETGKLRHIDTRVDNGAMQESIHDQVDVKVTISGQQFRLKAQRIDEYIAGNEHGMLKLHTLYMVPVTDNPQLDRAYQTTSYGLTPVAMSIIPGLGQLYKGSTVKAGCMLGATALGVAGIILCDNERASYIKKMKEQPKYAKDYNTKADNWETGRNICIGVTAAIWVYNLIDAAAAKGARRIAVEPAHGRYLSLHPVASPQSVGLSVAYTF